jgi:hypothetical protein
VTQERALEILAHHCYVADAMIEAAGESEAILQLAREASNRDLEARNAAEFEAGRLRGELLAARGIIASLRRQVEELETTNARLREERPPQRTSGLQLSR